MFLAIVFIILGLFLLLNTLGIIVGNFWGVFWAVVFLAIGFRLLAKRGKCPICASHWWSGKIHDKIHGNCCGCDNDHTGHDEKE